MAKRKTGKISNVERDIIIRMYNSGMPVEAISEMSDRSEDAVQKCLNGYDATEKVKDAAKEKEKKKHKRVKTEDFFTHKTDGGNKGVTVSTKTASERADATRESRVGQGRVHNRYSHEIHTLKEEDE